ncbi:MAG TPA: hypothetical protein DC054_16310 [Blastocatellia bacterium]|nr:hypothetical protein [Blastocatellia bacterium]
MQKHIRCFVAGVLSFLVVYGCLWLLGFLLEKSFDSAFKGNDIVMVSDTPSPNHGLIATTYINMGGGAAGWCYKEVNLRKNSEAFDAKKGQLFSTDCQTDVAVTWQGDDTAIIKYSTDGISASLTQKSLSDNKAVRVLYQTK